MPHATEFNPTQEPFPARLARPARVRVPEQDHGEEQPTWVRVRVRFVSTVNFYVLCGNDLDAGYRTEDTIHNVGKS
jgi:hypothetical protein